MATTTETEMDEAAVAHAGDHASHPGPRTYWMIFVILFAITAIEVLLFYVSVPVVNVNNAFLGVLALLKFAIVVGYFMHLRFDSRVLRRLFITGLVLATVVYIIYMLTMGVFLQPPDQRP